ncbi:hypothetical protein CR513_23540, partial [Mucuna pruriens]
MTFFARVFLEIDLNIHVVNMPILSWNVHREVNTKGCSLTQELVREHRPSLVILLETHCLFLAAMHF